jgi:hypothetical protein
MARASSAVAASGAKYAVDMSAGTARPRRDVRVQRALSARRTDPAGPGSPNRGSAKMTGAPLVPRGICMRSRSRPLVR